MTETRSYPRLVTTGAGRIEFRLMSRADETLVLDFARKLPAHDLLFLPRNIRRAAASRACGHKVWRSRRTPMSSRSPRR